MVKFIQMSVLHRKFHFTSTHVCLFRVVCSYAIATLDSLNFWNFVCLLLLLMCLVSTDLSVSVHFPFLECSVNGSSLLNSIYFTCIMYLTVLYIFTSIKTFFFWEMFLSMMYLVIDLSVFWVTIKYPVSIYAFMCGHNFQLIKKWD